MKKNYIYLCVFLSFIIFLSGCSNPELEELRYEKDIANKKVETIVNEYRTNIELFNSVETDVWTYLFADKVDIYSFNNYEIVFSDTEPFFTLYSAREQLNSYIKKYNLSVENIKESTTYYPFMDDKTGGVEVFYRIPIENYALLEMTFVIQEGKIISLDYSIKK